MTDNPCQGRTRGSSAKSIGSKNIHLPVDEVDNICCILSKLQYRFGKMGGLNTVDQQTTPHQ